MPSVDSPSTDASDSDAYSASQHSTASSSTYSPGPSNPRSRRNPNPNPNPRKRGPAASSRAPKRRRARARATPAPAAPTTNPPQDQALRGVPDALAPSLICVLIGLNPGLMTSRVGHMYAHPRNHFWRLLHAGGLTPDRVCAPETDARLPALYSLGLTNLVARPTAGQAGLARAEMAAGVATCEAKMRRWRPESVCVVGKGVWEFFWRARSGRGLGREQFVWGWQEERWGAGQGWAGARVYVVPSTSGLAAGIPMEFKRECWRTLGDWVQMRRRERGEVAPRVAAEVPAVPEVPEVPEAPEVPEVPEEGEGEGVEGGEREEYDESIFDEENTVEDEAEVKDKDEDEDS